jgi:hypothetical protein
VSTVDSLSLHVDSELYVVFDALILVQGSGFRTSDGNAHSHFLLGPHGRTLGNAFYGCTISYYLYEV